MPPGSLLASRYSLSATAAAMATGLCALCWSPWNAPVVPRSASYSAIRPSTGPPAPPLESHRATKAVASPDTPESTVNPFPRRTFISVSVARHSFQPTSGFFPIQSLRACISASQTAPRRAPPRAPPGVLPDPAPPGLHLRIPDRPRAGHDPVPLGILGLGQPFGQPAGAELLLDGIDGAEHRARGGALGRSGLRGEAAGNGAQQEREGEEGSGAHGSSLESGRMVAYPPHAVESKVSFRVPCRRG